MFIFVCMTNILLITSLISLLSNKLDKVGVFNPRRPTGGLYKRPRLRPTFHLDESSHCTNRLCCMPAMNTCLCEC